MTLPSIHISFDKQFLQRILLWMRMNAVLLLTILLTLISIASFLHYHESGLSLAYNDARSRLDIGRRVVEGLKPGLAQLGSVWLPLPHILMIPTVWNDFMWHSGLSGAIQSMASFVATGVIIYLILKKIGVGMVGRLFGVLVFVANLNILYLQSTAMTELLLLATMTIASYEFLLWYEGQRLYNLIRCAFWVMLSTLVRYDGWFLFFYIAVLIIFKAFQVSKWKLKDGFSRAEGLFVFFCTLAGFGIFCWLVWNWAIFKDPLYFAFGEFSAHAQQSQLEDAGVLQTKKDLLLSAKMYWFALAYNSITSTVILGLFGAIAMWTDKHLSSDRKIALTALLAPLIFNILALYLGHSVLFIQGISGNSWFNVRYGLMMMPSIAVFAGYFVHRFKPARIPVIGLFLFVAIFVFGNGDAVTIDDGRVGSSQKNVSEVSDWLKDNARDKEGFVLISAASHDAIIFSSHLPMKKFIHEGTGKYWESATTSPDRWARWIIMRTYDNNDLTYRTVSKTEWEEMYTLVGKYPFADIYEIKEEYLPLLNTTANLGKQK